MRNEMLLVRAISIDHDYCECVNTDHPRDHTESTMIAVSAVSACHLNRI